MAQLSFQVSDPRLQLDQALVLQFEMPGLFVRPDMRAILESAQQCRQISHVGRHLARERAVNAQLLIGVVGPRAPRTSIALRRVLAHRSSENPRGERHGNHVEPVPREDDRLSSSCIASLSRASGAKPPTESKVRRRTANEPTLKPG